MSSKRHKRLRYAKKATDVQIKRALIKHDGLMSIAADALKIARQSLHERVNSNAELADLVQELRHGHVDLAESVLTYRMRKHKDREAAKFVLQHRGRDRGYGQQPEIPPPPPDTSRRATIINALVLMLDQKAAAIHAQPQIIDAVPAGGALTPPKPNGHAQGSQAMAQLLASRRGKA